MKTPSRAFAADVELPCKLFWRSDGSLEFSGTAVSIDSGSVSLRIPGNGFPFPDVGEKVELEVLLPADSKQTLAKCLTVRAEVMRVTEVADGSRRLDLNFRKAAFKDVAAQVRPKVQKVKAAKGWELQ